MQQHLKVSVSFKPVGFFFFLLKIRSRTKSVSVFPHRSWLFHDSLVVWILIAFPIVSATYLSHWNQILTPRWETGDRPLSLSLSASCLLSPVCVCVCVGKPFFNLAFFWHKTLSIMCTSSQSVHLLGTFVTSQTTSLLIFFLLSF